MEVSLGIRTLYNPPLFQGRRRKRSYFEGWYFKFSPTVHTEDHNAFPETLAFIPGISIDAEGQRKAFVQVNSSTMQQSWYVPYPIEEFSAARKKFLVTIGKNRFSATGLQLDITHGDLRVQGEVTFRDIVSYPSSLLSPGIMGWYAFVPKMECNHGVVSLHHKVQGEIAIGERTVVLDSHTGYIEKDWGSSFPEAWVWLQSSTWTGGIRSVLLSVAKIPFLGRFFIGCLGYVLLEDRLIRFGTYTGAVIEAVDIGENAVSVTIRNGKERLAFKALGGTGAHLAAPRQGSMDRVITESLDGTVDLEVRDRSGATVCSGTGYCSGVEFSDPEILRDALGGKRE